MAAEQNQRDLVLRPGDYTFISDENKGKVDVHVGPHKATLGNTDKPVIFSQEKYRFVPTQTLDEAIKQVIVAPKGFYVVLKNPAKGGLFPKAGGASDTPEIEFGKKVNIPGPTSFALWPGQMAKIIRGHHLRSNQYLLVRVYDQEAAKENWDKAVVMKSTSEPPKPSAETSKVGVKEPEQLLVRVCDQENAKEYWDKAVVMKSTSEPPKEVSKAGAKESELKKEDVVTGMVIVIKGTDVTFYIPPTGIEVLSIGEKEYVQDAVTLERLEYCVLLDEDGNKRYVKGPDVVFPSPTETFLTRDVDGGKTRKFKAIELNEISGLYIKVIEPYTEGGKEFKEGDELFLTGADLAIYFPRPEHSIIKYGDKETHFAVAVPAGEARYIMDRLSGVIETVKGPQMSLPDPRRSVSVRRVLSPKMIALMYPGNNIALTYNADLAGIDQVVDGYISDVEYTKTRGMYGSPGQKGYQGTSNLVASAAAAPREKVFTKGAVSDEIQRGTKFTPPRTITLDSKYDGAVKINVWTGYSVLIVNGKGERKVIVGPAVYHLEYDEYLEKLSLSTGKPKSSDHLLEDVYLRVKNNLVSDIILAETKDLIEVAIRVSYRVNFEDDYKEKWFNVENYVKFLTDDLRSIVRNIVKKTGIQEFNASYIDIVRNIILGSEKTKEGERVGRLFKDNGMRVADVEVLELSIKDSDIDQKLFKAQRDIIQKTIEVTTAGSSLEAERALAKITTEKNALAIQVAKDRANSQKQIFTHQEAEAKARVVLDKKNIERRKEVDLEQASITQAVLKQQQEHTEELATLAIASKFKVQAKQKEVDAIADEILRSRNLVSTDKADADMKTRIDGLNAEAEAREKELKALQPELVAALEALAQTNLIKDIGPNIVPLSILENTSIVGALKKLFEGTAAAPILDKLDPRSKALTTAK